MLVRDVTSGEEILLTKLEFDTGEVLSQAKQDWVNRLDAGTRNTTYNKTVSLENNLHNVIFEQDSTEEAGGNSTMYNIKGGGGGSKNTTKYK